MGRKLWWGSLPLRFIQLTFAFLAPSLIATACTSSDQPTSDEEVIPPPGIEATIPADFPEAESTMLRALAFSSDDLPEGFELQYEDAAEEDAGIYYVAHYFNTKMDEEDLFGGGLVTADVFVLVADDAADARSFFEQLASMSEAELSDYMKGQGHWSADPELASQLEQMGVDAQRIEPINVPSPSMGWLTAETLRVRGSNEELTAYDVGVAVLRGRVFGGASLGSGGTPPDQQDVEDLANELADRIAVLSP